LTLQINRIPGDSAEAALKTLRVFSDLDASDDCLTKCGLAQLINDVAFMMKDVKESAMSKKELIASVAGKIRNFLKLHSVSSRF
jgi:hypothetical protein